MKNIKFMLIAFATVLLMSSTAFAQRSGQNPERADRMVQMITEKLDLTDDQVTLMKVIHQEFSEKMKSLRAANGDRKAMTETVEKLKAQKDTAIEELLTEEQMTKWEAMKTERIARPKMERPQGKPNADVKGERPQVKRPNTDVKGERVEGVKRPKVERPNMEKGERVEGVKRPKAERPNMDVKGKRAEKPRGKKVDKLQQALGLSDNQIAELKKVMNEYGAKIKELKTSGARKGKIKRVYKKQKAAVKKLLTPEQFEKWLSLKAGKKIRKNILK